MESIILVLIITQIIVESLPISSSGHMALIGLLANRFFGIQNTVLPDFLDNLLHGTALLAILIVFFKDWFSPVKKLIQAGTQFLFKSKPLSFAQKKLVAIFIKIVGLVIVTDLVTSIFYFVIKVIFKKTIFVDSFGNLEPNFLLLGFIITMLLLFSLRLRKPHGMSFTQSFNSLRLKFGASPIGDGSTLRQSSGQAFEPTGPLVLRSEPNERLEASPRARLLNGTRPAVPAEATPSEGWEPVEGYVFQKTFNLKKAVILGMVQGCALLPGISRFASTYVAGYWLNISPRRAFQISFLIHFPLIIAAFLFLGIKDVIKKPEILQNMQMPNLFLPSLFLILMATVFAIVALNLCYKLAVKNKLWWFGFYMLIPIFTLIYFLC